MTSGRTIDNAPLIRSECFLGWNDDNDETYVSPESLRNAVRGDDHYTEPEFELLGPRDMLRVIDTDQPFYQISYSGNGINCELILSKAGITVACDETYQTWREFRTEIEHLNELITPLLETESKVVRVVRLRYVDAFDAETLKGKTPTDFITSELGVDIVFPERVRTIVQGEKSSAFFFNYRVPLHDSLSMEISMGEANVSDERPAAICDVTVQQVDEHRISSVTTSADTLHSLADDFFFGLIEPIEDRFNMRSI